MKSEKEIRYLNGEIDGRNTNSFFSFTEKQENNGGAGNETKSN